MEPFANREFSAPICHVTYYDTSKSQEATPPDADARNCGWVKQRAARPRKVGSTQTSHHLPTKRSKSESENRAMASAGVKFPERLAHRTSSAESFRGTGLLSGSCLLVAWFAARWRLRTRCDDFLMRKPPKELEMQDNTLKLSSQPIENSCRSV